MSKTLLMSHAQATMTFSELYFHFVEPHLVESRDHWDNLSDEETYPRNDDSAKQEGDGDGNIVEASDIEDHAHESFDACRAACDAKPRCMQFLHHGSICRLHYSVRLGHYRGDGGDGDAAMVRSGWMLQRIRAWTEATPCEEAKWV